MNRLGALVLLLGCAYLGVCIAGRLGSQWPLEWMEGASVLHAQRLVSGLPLYAAPRADFAPFVYPPLSYVPMGVGLLISDGALWGARLASVLALVVCVLVLARTEKLAAGLFAFGYGYCGAFVDLARVDAVFMALCLCGVSRLCAARHAQGLALLALACLAKQHALLLLAAASVGVVYCDGRRSLPLLLGVWGALALGIAALCLWTDGWIWTYCVTVPGRHGLLPSLLASFVLVDMCVYLPLLSALCLFRVLTRRDPAAVRLHWLLAAAVLASALGRAHPGGDDNVRLPAFALACLVAALSFRELWAERARFRWVLGVGLAVQLGMLFQPPALYAAKGEQDLVQLQAALRDCAGGSDFAAMDHSGLGAHAFVHTLALSDLRMNRDALGEAATRAVVAALSSADAPAAIAISSAFPALMEVLAEHYSLCARAPGLQLPTGYALPESFIYKHKAR